MSENKSTKVVKKRNWCFFVYPESAPANWTEILQQRGLVFTVSPLHDKDVAVKNVIGEEKKPHWHVIACWNGPTAYSVVKALTDELNAPIPKPCENIRGYYRYFTHKDNPDKYQYDEKEIRSFNGFNIADYIEQTKSEVNQIKRQLQRLIRDKNIIEYAELMYYLDDNAMYNEHDVANSNTMFFSKLITSRRHMLQIMNSDFPVDENGETIEIEKEKE
jgi:hypothetical protein